MDRRAVALLEGGLGGICDEVARNSRGLRVGGEPLGVMVG